MSGRQDSRRGSRRRLDARGSREVLYCHECEHEWFRESRDLTCPQCSSHITEIIDHATDPRPRSRSSRRARQGSANDHNNWVTDRESDPDEVDIDELMDRQQRGSRRESRGNATRGDASRRRESNSRPGRPVGAQDDAVRGFQDLIGSILGPNFRTSEPGRSDSNTLYSGPGWTGGTFQFGGRNGTPRVTGGSWTFSTTVGGPDRTRGVQAGASDPFNLLSEMFGSMPPQSMHGRPATHVHGHFQNNTGDGPPGFNNGMPPQMQEFFSLFHPIHNINGDTVHTQEAMDRIMTQLMEQHPSSNAPGPAPKSDIENLPKIKLNEHLLGPEGKGECSVCMDDVTLDDEVVQLPCAHWFHQQCASAWLSEHNTCPICRKSISGENKGGQQPVRPATAPAEPSDRRPSAPDTTERNERSHSSSQRNSPRSRRQEERLAAIREMGRVPAAPSRSGSIVEDQRAPSLRRLSRSNPQSHSRRHDYPDYEEPSPRTQHAFTPPLSVPGSLPERIRRDSLELNRESASRHGTDRDGRSGNSLRERQRDRERARDTNNRERNRPEYSESVAGSSVSSFTDRRRSRADARDRESRRDNRREPRRESSGLPSWLRDTFNTGGSSSRRGD